MMDISAVYSHVAYLFQKSAGIWLLCWAIRYKADWDYKLGGTAKSVRWAVVTLAYVLATLIPGPSLGYVRVVIWLIGLCFLCWPNLAYYLTNLFCEWPTATGIVISHFDSGDRWIISYDFEFSNELYGGAAKVKPSEGLSIADSYPEGRHLVVRFDPLNPSQSRLVSFTQNFSAEHVGDVN
jgi:hypothetical protein